MKSAPTSLFVIPLTLSLLAATASAWIRVVDFEDYPITTAESAMQERGWIFQDYDFAGYPECLGTIDCTGVRDIVEAPYGGNGRAILIRGSDPAVIGAANARSVSLFELPESAWIPLGGQGTFYMRVAAENLETSIHWGLTADSRPLESVNTPQSGPDAKPTIGYGELAVTSQLALNTERQTVSVFNNGWQAATLEQGMNVVPGQWYELWYQIYNEPFAAGGGYFDLFIRGGVWEEITHLDNPYSDVFTDWGFRNLTDAALRRFLVIMNPGWPAAGPLRQGAVFYDDLYMLPGELTLEVPPIRVGDGPGPGPESLWAHVPTIEGSAWKFTGLGFMFDETYPFIYLYEAGTWAYVEPSVSTLDMMAIYHFNLDAWIYTTEALAGWYYHLTDPTHGNGGWNNWFVPVN